MHKTPPQNLLPDIIHVKSLFVIGKLCWHGRIWRSQWSISHGNTTIYYAKYLISQPCYWKDHLECEFSVVHFVVGLSGTSGALCSTWKALKEIEDPYWNDQGWQMVENEVSFHIKSKRGNDKLSCVVCGGSFQRTTHLINTCSHTNRKSHKTILPFIHCTGACYMRTFCLSYPFLKFCPTLTLVKTLFFKMNSIVYYVFLSNSLCILFFK